MRVPASAGLRRMWWTLPVTALFPRCPNAPLPRMWVMLAANLRLGRMRWTLPAASVRLGRRAPTLLAGAVAANEVDAARKRAAPPNGGDAAPAKHVAAARKRAACPNGVDAARERAAPPE